MRTITSDRIDEIVEKILKMSKYKDVEIPLDTIISLIEKSVPISSNMVDLEKRVREKLHNIVAPYLGDMDYSKAVNEFRQISGNIIALREFAQKSLTSHASTKERGEDLAAFYQMLFSQIGSVGCIADLACGLHPLGLPFMELPLSASYYAYDLNKARVEFLNIYITEQGYSGGCFHQDILINPPTIKFDVAFFFKEAHRFEKREAGAMPRFIDSILASKVVISLPLQSLGTHNPLSPKYETTLCKYAEGRGWPLESFEFGNEIFYIISKCLEGGQK